jgi:hypothetical protein
MGDTNTVGNISYNNNIITGLKSGNTVEVTVVIGKGDDGTYFIRSQKMGIVNGNTTITIPNISNMKGGASNQLENNPVHNVSTNMEIGNSFSHVNKLPLMIENKSSNIYALPSKPRTPRVYKNRTISQRKN